jgi:hypothetical protein
LRGTKELAIADSLSPPHLFRGVRAPVPHYKGLETFNRDIVLLSLNNILTFKATTSFNT